MPRKSLTVSEIPGAHPVSIRTDGRNKYAVAYGLQEKSGLNWHQAAREFGNCVFHAMECAGLIDRTR